MGDLVDFLCKNEDGFRKARLPALYSDFRGQRATNPDGYAANVSAWRGALATIARSGLATTGSGKPNLLVLNTDDGLLRALENRQYGRPLALGAVVQEAIAAGDLIPLQDFQTAKQSIYDNSSSWSSLPLNVVSWGFRQIGSLAGFGGPSDKLPKAQLVVVANLEAAAKSFREKTAEASSRFERTWSKPHFIKTFSDNLLPTNGSTNASLTSTDVDVFLIFLLRDKKLLVYDGNVVKIKDPVAQEPATITEEDAAIAQLKELREYLGHQTRVLEQRIQELAAAAKDAVAKKSRVSALAALKSKKQAESSLAARFASLAQLDEVATRIEQAADQVQLVRVMESSAGALRSLNARVGGVERVEDVVDRLREQMDAVDEVGSILAESAAGPVLDEAELDDELAALEGEEKRKEDEKAEKETAAREAKEMEDMQRQIDALPSPPTRVPGEAAKSDAVERETLEGLSRMSLEEARPA